MRHLVEIGKKLELTATALGCLTRKELCAAFERVNPSTVLTVQNSYNWMSGRAAPRNFSLFEDWASVLHLPEGPHFIMSASLADFAAALSQRFSLPDSALEPLGLSRPVREGASEPQASWRNGALLQGSFLVLGTAWSPLRRGQLLLGAIRFEPCREGLAAVYSEQLLGRCLRFSGQGPEDGRSGQLVLQCDANAGTYFMSFHLPTLPGNLSGGIFAGNALYDPQAQPTAGVLLFLRNHSQAHDGLEANLGYRPLDPSSLAQALDWVGYGEDPKLAAEHALLTLLSEREAEPVLSVRQEAVAQAAALLDQRRLLMSKAGS